MKVVGLQGCRSQGCRALHVFGCAGDYRRDFDSVVERSALVFRPGTRALSHPGLRKPQLAQAGGGAGEQHLARHWKQCWASQKRRTMSGERNRNAEKGESRSGRMRLSVEMLPPARVGGEWRTIRQYRQFSSSDESRPSDGRKPQG